MSSITVEGQLRKSPGSFNQFAQHLRITRSRHTGWWIIEELNSVYGYWCTIRGDKPGSQYAIPQQVVDFMLALPAYVGPLHEQDAAFRSNTLCG